MRFAPWVIIIIALAAMLWQQHRIVGDLQGELNRLAEAGGFQVVSPDSSVVATRPVVVSEPNWLDRILKTSDLERFDREIKSHITDSIDLALKQNSQSVEAVTVLNATSRGDSLSFGIGLEIEDPRFNLSVSAPDEYTLWFKPQKYQVTIVKSDKTDYAELTNLTTGERLPIYEFKQRLVDRGWISRWFKWEVGVAWSLTHERVTPLAGVVLLERSKGTTTWSIGRVWATMDEFAVGVTYGN